MTTRNILKHLRFTIVALLLLIPTNLFADFVFSDEYGWALDLPESFYLKQKDGNTSFYFEHDFMQAKVAIKLFNQNEYKDANEALYVSLDKLKADGEINTFEWQGQECSIANFSFSLPYEDVQYKGYACAVTIPKSKAHFVLLSYSDEKVFTDLEQFLLSILDSLYISDESFVTPGLVTTFAFPKSEDCKIEISINNQNIQSKIDKDAVDASAFVIEREYAVLSLYADKDNWQSAWARYYRMIFRDTYSRLENISLDLQKALWDKAQAAAFQNKTTVQYEYSQILLLWVQNLEIGTTSNKTDFTPIPSIFFGAKSDCDSRSLLMCILLEHTNIDCTLFVSREYGHAIFGCKTDSKGYFISVGDVNYTLGETTAHVALGVIAQEQSDITKWLPITLP